MVRKIYLFAMFLCLSMVFIACQKNEFTLIEQLNLYQEKINAIIEEDKDEGYITYVNHQTLAVASMTSRDELMAIYEEQPPHHLNDVRVEGILSIYKALLDEIIDSIEETDYDKVEIDLSVHFRDYANLDATIKVLKEGSILIKVSINLDGEVYYSGLIMGYENEDFYLRELEMHDGQNYYYFEFFENHHMIHIRYSPEASWYRYQNQNDNTFYEISQSHVSENPYLDIRWFDPETNMRISIMESEERYQSVEFFNEKGIYFEYFEFIETSEVILAWQMLEATGWDQCYKIPDRKSEQDGIYLGETNLTPNAKVNLNMSETHVNLRVEYKLPKVDLTDHIINLSHYGLTFNYDHIDMAYIENAMTEGLNEANTLSVYRGVDFLNDNLKDVLYDIIDEEIRP